MFGVVSGVGLGMGVIDFSGDRRRGRGSFGDELGTSHCNQWGLCDALFSNYFEDLLGLRCCCVPAGACVQLLCGASCVRAAACDAAVTYKTCRSVPRCRRRQVDVLIGWTTDFTSLLLSNHYNAILLFTFYRTLRGPSIANGNVCVCLSV